MSNAIMHTHNIHRKAEWKTTHELSISHYQTINSYRLILISIQTDHGVHILACTYVHDFTHARKHRCASAHVCRYICVYGTHIYLQIQTPINISLIKEQTEHNIGEVCINSLGWYDARTVTNNIIITIIKAYYNRERDRERDRQADRDRDRQTETHSTDT